MRNFTKQFLAFFVCLTLGYSSFAQLSQGGDPYTFTHASQPKSGVSMNSLQKPDMAVVNQTDMVNDLQKDHPYRVAIAYPVNYNVVNSGTWETTADGGSLWRLKIHVDDAKALSFSYHNVFLPTGGKFFIYNEYENHVIGAFTSEYNYENTIRATQMIQGETVTLEYYAPAGVTETPIIEMKEVIYYYRGVEDFVNPYIELATGIYPPSLKADPCQVDVACSPEIDGWEEQRDAVVHYVFPFGGGYSVCSGSMINNTAEDCTPYMLSAWHCGEPTTSTNLNNWVWYFNYQKATCSPNANGNDPNKGTQTMTGGNVVASSGNGTLNNPPGNNQVAGSDFYLVEFNSQPPASYNAFYAGWDRGTSASPSGVGIHHPAGSAKKISTYTSALGANGNFNGSPTNGHWVVQWAATANGHGVTEGGSSGSPIFNNVGRIVGQLSGGSSFCTNTSATDVYGKMSVNWTSNGSTAAAQLAPWLDPNNTGATVLDGAYEPCNQSNPPNCNINASTLNINVGGTVDFTDGSTGSPTSWQWDFDHTGVGGATPSTSSVQNPGTVTFNNAGTYEVELIATNANGPCTTTVDVNVTVFSGCDSLMNLEDTNTLQLYGAGGGFVTGNNQYGDLAKAEKYSSGYGGTHVTGSDVYFAGGQDGGNGATVDLTVWADNGSGLPGAVLGTSSYSLANLVNAMASNNNQGIFFLAFDQSVPVGGNDFYIGIDMSSFGAGDTIGIVSNQYNVATPANTGYEQWSDGTWHDMESAWGGGGQFDISMFMSAHLTDAPVSGTASASATTICVGQTVDLSSTGTNVTGQTWYMTGATPATSTNATETVTYSAAGSYTAYLVLEGSCNGSYLDSVEIVVTDGPTVTSTGTDPTCAGNDGTITVSATNGAAPYTYSIDNGATTQTNGSFTGLAAGSYDIVVADANGCSSTDTYTLGTGGGALSVTSTTSDPTCSGNDGSIDITVTGGTAPYTYSIDNGVTTQSSGTFNGLMAGNYTIVVTDANGCVGNDSQTLNPGSGSITATASSTNPSCGSNDGTITIDVPTDGMAPYQYSIDGGNTFSSNTTYNNLSVGTYDIVIEDAGGCQGTTSVTLANPGGPTITATSTNLNCFQSNDGTITANGSGGAAPLAYSIDGANFGSSNIFNGLSAGTYTVFVEDNNGCQSSTTVTLVEPSQISQSASVTDATCGNANGSITVTVNGGAAPYSYSLDGAAGTSQNTFNNLTSGNYTIQVTDANGCMTMMTTETVGGGAAISVTASTVNETCMDANGSIAITVNGGSAPYSYSNDGGATSQTGSTFAGLSAGNYAIVVTDADGCSANTNATITNTGGFTLNVNPNGGQTICEGNTANISASGAGIGATYSWDQGLGTGASHNVSPAVTTTYSVVATDNAGCTSSSDVTITVETEPTVTVIPNNPTICSGDMVSLTANGASSYVWNTGATTSTIDVSPSNQTTYTVIGQNGSCAGTPVQVVVVVDAAPTVVAGSDVINISTGGTVNFTNAGSVATSYSWNFGDGQSSTQGFVSHTYNVPGTYTVVLTGTIGNCTATDTITITVGVDGVEDLDLENAVSIYPNPNDGFFNLKLDFIEAINVEVRVYSAIGQLIELQVMNNINTSIVEYDLSSNAEGIYLVQVKTNKGTITKRVTVSK